MARKTKTSAKAEARPERVEAEVLPKHTKPANERDESEPDRDSEDDEAGKSEVNDEDVAEVVLAEVDPATDEELTAIERDLRSRFYNVPPRRETPSTALVRRDPLDAYMADVRRYPLLSREDEHELAKLWVEQGDTAAARKLVTSNLRLVVKIAHEYRRAYQNLLDLVQEGNMGLVRAVQKFDPYRGVKLSTYSGWWIRAYILKYILNNWRLVKIGTTQNQRKLFFNLRKQTEALRAAGVDPTPETLAEALDVSTHEVEEMQRRMGSPDLSLNAPLGGDDGESTRTRLDLIEDPHADSDPGDTIEGAEFRDLLHDKLRRFGATLSGRELEIFRDRLMSDEPVTLQDLGERWQVSRERARQIEKRLLLRLRGHLQQELGDAVEIALGHD